MMCTTSSRHRRSGSKRRYCYNGLQCKHTCAEHMMKICTSTKRKLSSFVCSVTNFQCARVLRRFFYGIYLNNNLRKIKKLLRVECEWFFDYMNEHSKMCSVELFKKTWALLLFGQPYTFVCVIHSRHYISIIILNTQNHDIYLSWRGISRENLSATHRKIPDCSVATHPYIHSMCNISIRVLV